MTKNKSVIVVGGGAAGLMSAIHSAWSGAEVIIFEKNSRPARKVLITGKGRCNVTNNCSIETVMNNTPTNPKFLYSALNRFSPEDTMSFFEMLGVELKTERGNRVFPVSDKAKDIADALINCAESAGCSIYEKNIKSLIIENNTIKGVKDSNGVEYFADSVILACGGASYPKTGSDGYGYVLARQAGHTVTKIKPSLVPLESIESYCCDMMGLSLRNIKIDLLDTKTEKTIYSDFGELLFTHFGLSGPIVLSASSHIKEMESGRYKIIIDLKPALSEEQLDARILRDFSEFKNKDFINSLGKLLPQKMIPVIISLSGISEHKKCNEITRAERHELLKLIKAFPITIKAFRPIAEAIVTSGGVSVKEISCNRNIIGMYKIHPFPGIYPLKQSSFQLPDRIPPHMRHFTTVCKLLHFHRKDTQSPCIFFFRKPAHQLHPQTNSQYGHFQLWDYPI